MSILIDSSLEYEFPYQIGLYVNEKLDDFFKHHKNDKFDDWVFSINITHSDLYKEKKIFGPEISKKYKTYGYSIFTGSLKTKITSQEITIIFITDLLTGLFKILEKENFTISKPNYGGLAEEIIKKISLNYDSILKEYEDDDDELEL